MAIGREDVSDIKRRREESSSPSSDMSMMRIAVAGTGGLGRLFAHYIDQETSHHVVFLSRQAQPSLNAGGFQVSVVDYSDQATLAYALHGIDTIISTVTGPNQLELIRAALAARVRRFVPAEFEGPPQLRTAGSPLDRHRTVAQQWLAQSAQRMQSTTFICGILYERFQPGGLHNAHISVSFGLGSEGDYIMNCRGMEAQVPAYDAQNNPDVTICMTAAQDVARFVTRAIDLPQWPAEMKMCGQRVAVKDLVAHVERLKGQVFNPVQWHNPASLRSALQVAVVQQDNARAIRLHALIATAEGHYDYTQPNLNRAFPDVQPITFQDWFIAKWTQQQ